MSQFGENFDIDDLLGRAPHGYACEVGAYDGITLSNTFYLEERGWDVLCVEANPLCAGHLTLNRKLVKMVACGKEHADGKNFTVFQTGTEGNNYAACSALDPDPDRPQQENERVVGEFNVPVRTLDSLLNLVGFPRLDLLSIDVEGGEADVLCGFDIAWWAPKVIIIEDWKGGKMRRNMLKCGYRLYRRRGVNEVYTRE